MKLLKRLLSTSIVKWVANTNIKHTQENQKYLLVSVSDDENYLFTQNQVDIAKERAAKNKEDINI